MQNLFPFAQTVLQESINHEIDVLFSSLWMLVAVYGCCLLMSAISLRAAVQWICQIRLTFLHALVYSAIVMFFFYCIGDIFMVLFGSRTDYGQAITVLILSYLVSIGLSAFFYGTIIENKYERTIGIGNGLAVFFAQLIANAVLMLIIAIPVGVVIGLMSLSSGT